MVGKSLGNSNLEAEIGGHRIQFVAPDLIRIWWNGECRTADFMAIVEQGHRWTEQRQHFVLADVSNLKTLDAAARKNMAEDPRVHRVMGMAVIGATFHLRVLLSLVTKAADYIQKKQHGLTRFFATETEALAWIASERERLGLPLAPNPKP